MKTSTKYWLIGCMALSCGIASHAQYTTGPALTPQERQKATSAWKESCKSMQENRVGEVVVMSEGFKKGKPKHSSHLASKKVMNPNGQLVSDENYRRNGKLLYQVTLSYDAHEHLTEQQWLTQKGKCSTRNVHHYEGDLLTQTQVLRGSAHRLWQRIDYTYDADGRLASSKTFRGKHANLRTYSKYAYYEDGTKKRAEKYNRHDKLIAVTDYACDQAGKTLAKDDVKERIVCERYEHDANGEELRVVETLNEYHGTERTVSKYNSRNKLVDMTRYDASGKVKSHWLYSYDSKGYLLASERRIDDDRIDMRSEYTRNELGLATSEVVKNGDGEIVLKLAYAYNFY